MISIVLPSYNGAKYIRQSVESVLCQTYKDWELIIVDDCSTDNTLEIAKEYEKKDKRIRVIHNQTNQKLPKSLNIGFEYASGEYFTWTSDDNVYGENAIERMFMELEWQEVDFVFADYSVIDPDDYVIYHIKTGPVHDLYIKDVVGACFLYKREIHFEIGGYRPEKFLVEDYDFWLRAQRKFRLFHMDENLYFYRIHPSSLTAERKDAIEEQTVKLLEENICYVPNERKGMKSQMYRKIKTYYKRKQSYWKVLQYYRKEKKEKYAGKND